jgi:hypothetical protein
MAEKISYAGTASAIGGPKITFDFLLEGTAYTKMNIPLADNEKKTVPLVADNSITRLLLVRSTAYGATLKAGKDDASLKPLEAPLFLGGAGAVALVADPLTALVFENKLGKSVSLDIFIAVDPAPAVVPAPAAEKEP